MLTRRERTPLRKLMLLSAMAGAGALVEDTATGNPLTFITDVSKPLKSLLIPFTPVQSGTGDPSPQNKRSILPWNGLKVFGGGKNLLNPTKYVFNTITSMGLTFEVQSDGSVKVTGTTESSDFGPTLSVRFKLHAGTYYGYRDDGNVYVAYRKSTSEEGGVTTGLISPFTLDGSEWVYCNIYVRNPGTFDTIIHPQIARENAQSSYEPYKPITDTDISFPSPVYGGQHEAVSGVLTNSYPYFSFKWSDCIEPRTIGDFEERKYSHGGICSSTNGGKGKCNVAPHIWTGSGTTRFYVGSNYFIICLPLGTAESTDIEICALAVTPQEQTMTGHQITAIKGSNTMWSDADGQMTAVYLKKG